MPVGSTAADAIRRRRRRSRDRPRASRPAPMHVATRAATPRPRRSSARPGYTGHLDAREAVGGHELAAFEPLGDAGAARARRPRRAPRERHPRDRRPARLPATTLLSTTASAAATTVVPEPPFDDQQHASTLLSQGATNDTDEGRKRGPKASRRRRRPPPYAGGVTATRPFIVQTPVRDVAPLGSRRVEAAFFDLDKTVIAKASMVAFGRPFYREGLISRRLLLRALYGQLVYMHLGADEARLARMRDSVLALTKGGRRHASARSSRRRCTTWSSRSSTTKHSISSASIATQAARLHRLRVARGDRGAARSIPRRRRLISPLGARWTRKVGTRARPSCTATDRRRPSSWSRSRRRRGIDLAASYAYSDSATDIPMLECVGHAVAVNPDRELAARGTSARLGDSNLHPSCPAARSDADSAAGSDHCGGRDRGGRASEAARSGGGCGESPPAPRSHDRTGCGDLSRYAARTFRAATAASATRTTRRSSFFMAADLRAVLAIALRASGAGARRRRGQPAATSFAAVCRLLS